MLWVNDQYLFVSAYYNLEVVDLQTNKINILSEQRVHSLSIINSKVISVDDDCTIKIWKLNDLKLFKKFKNKKLNPIPFFSICADSKRLAASNMNDDLIIYDFTNNLRKKYLKHL